MISKSEMDNLRTTYEEVCCLSHIELRRVLVVALHYSNFEKVVRLEDMVSQAKALQEKFALIESGQ